ncbi:ankyrin repeat and sterile alpha motif domain-containing protein 1B-like isoform X3 [Lineus longissimus]|uniref:ankyrin repeat and sterile alpha motif domain-containing protein 1B-like isoform X3 n=1 Tax=Lineus longissimus TaxID=88925 RepID=UPI00315C4D34
MGKDQELLEAGRSGDISVIEKLLSPRTKKTGSIVPPVFASLRRGPGPNVQDTNGDTSLHLAALNGHKDAVKTLLHYDASANIVDNTGCYPLHLAAWSGNAEICDILLTHGPSIAKVNEQTLVDDKSNAAGDTALHTAAQYGHAEAVQVLLTNHADPTIRNNRDETALDLASQYGRIQTVNLLLKHCISLLSCATIKHSPLHLASRNGHRNVVTALLDAGFDINTCTENGSALHEAALYGKPEVVKLLLTRDIDTSLQDTQGKTALELIENHTSPKALQIANVIRVHTGELYQDSDLEQPNQHRLVHPADSISSYEYVNEVQSDSPDLNDILDLESPVEEQVPLPQSSSLYENVPTLLPKPVPAPRRARMNASEYRSVEEYASKQEAAQVPIQVIKETRRTSNSPPVPERSSSMTHRREDQKFEEEIYDTPRPDLPPKDYRRKSSTSNGPYLEIGEIKTPASKQRTISNASNKNAEPFPEIRRPLVDESSTYLPMGEVKRNVSEDNNGTYIRMENIKSAGKMEMEVQTKEKKPSERLIEDSSGSDDDDFIPPNSEEEEEEMMNTYELLSEAHSGRISESNSSDDVSLSESAEKSEQENMEKDPAPDEDSGVEELPKEPLPTKAISKPPSLEFDSKRSSRASRTSTCSEIPVSPTGYIQPPTPDFPPPSPMTAILGIQEHINPKDKRRSRDMETSVEAELLYPRLDEIKASSVTTATLQDEEKPVDSTENSCDDLDDEDAGSDSSDGEQKPVVEEVKPTEKEPFLGLIKGANAGGQRRAISAIYDNIVIVGNSRPKRASMSSIPPHFDPLLENEEGLTPVFKDLDEIVSDIKMHRQNRRSTSSRSDSEGSDRRSAERGLVNGAEDSGSNAARRDQRRTMIGGVQGQDDSDDWAEISDIVTSFGGRMSTSYYGDVEIFETQMTTLMRKKATGKVQSVGEWLEGRGLGQYENILVANGFDDMDFMGSNVLEEADLFEMGIYNDDHRCRIVDATKKLPQLKSIDVNNLPESVEAWLKTLHLTSYLSTFIDHDFCSMEKVHKMWELELTTVLDITTLGHRKRILASLGNKGSEKNKETLESLDFSNLSRSCSKSSYTASHSTLSETWNLSPVSVGPSTDEVFSFGDNLESKQTDVKDSPIKDINLFKDYTNVKSTVEPSSNGTHGSVSSVSTGSSSSINMGTSSIRREKRRSRHEDQVIRRSNRVSYSGIDLRPPIETMTEANDEVHAWRHRPEVLIKGCCNYVAHYLGSTLIRDLQGLDSTKESIVKMKQRYWERIQKATDQIAKVPMIMLSITFKGVKFIDAKTKKVICEHEIGNIFCACQDSDHLNFFAYITKDLATGKHYCHVFSVKTNDLAAEIILTLGEAFEVAYQVALKERALQTEREYEEQLDETEREFEAALN